MSASAARLPFWKMHGAGNDFVVLDWRDAARTLSPALATRLADRHLGVGCDQILSVEPARNPGSIAAYGIWNADGSAARQCGNGARCVAAWLRRQRVGPADRFVLDSPAGPVEVEFHGDEVEVALGAPRFEPAAAGFSGDVENGASIDHEQQRLAFGVVSMGNPHAVIEVADVDRIDVAGIGRALQRDPRFADSCNVGFAQRIDASHLRLRVFERGVGETLACGSGACAAVAVLARRGRVGSEVAVDLPGGRLQIRWPGGAAPMRMRGPAVFVFEGELEP
jgi:diaminopimelate epimerase